MERQCLRIILRTLMYYFVSMISRCIFKKDEIVSKIEENGWQDDRSNFVESVIRYYGVDNHLSRLLPKLLPSFL